MTRYGRDWLLASLLAGTPRRRKNVLSMFFYLLASSRYLRLWF
jgi:hypothetical protein